MPKVVYKPEGVDTPREWDFNPGKMISPEMGLIERVTGMLFPEWVDAFGKGSVTAIHAFLFVMLKRETPSLKPDDVVFVMDDVSLDLTDDEAVQYATALAKMPERSDEEQAQLDDLVSKGYLPKSDDAGEGEGGPKEQPET